MNNFTRQKHRTHNTLAHPAVQTEHSGKGAATRSVLNSPRELTLMSAKTRETEMCLGNLFFSFELTTRTTKLIQKLTISLIIFTVVLASQLKHRYSPLRLLHSPHISKDDAWLCKVYFSVNNY